MITCLSANDSYKINQKINEISKKLDVDPIFFDAQLKEFSLSEVEFEVISVDLFNPTKCIVVQNASFLSSKSKLSESDENLFYEILNQSSDIHLIFTLLNLKFDSKKKTVKKLKELGEIIQFEDVSQIDIKQAFTQANKKYDLGLKQEHINRLSEYTPTLPLAISAIEKLKLLEEPATLEIIDLLVNDDSDIGVFDLSNAIIERRMKDVFVLYETLKSRNTDISSFIYLLASRFRQLHQALSLTQSGYSIDELSQIMGINSKYGWVLVNKIAKGHTMKSTLKVLAELSKFDRQSKTYMVDKNTEFELFLVRYGRNYGKS